MKTKMINRNLLIVALAIVATACCSQVQAGKASKSFNPFEPLYDIDSHSVTPNLGHSESADKIGSLARQVRGDAGSTITSPSTVNATKGTTRLLLLQTTRPAQSSSEGGGGASVQATTKQQLEPTTASESHEVRSFEEKPPVHWSALENYYKRLRIGFADPTPASQQGQYQHQIRNQYQPIYHLMQQDHQQEIGDQHFGSVSNPWREGSPYTALTRVSGPTDLIEAANRGSSDQQQRPIGPIQSNTRTNQAFQIPFISNAAQSPPSADPDFGFATVHHASAPGISRQGGIGAGSILLTPHNSSEKGLTLLSSADQKQQQLQRVELAQQQAQLPQGQLTLQMVDVDTSRHKYIDQANHPFHDGGSRLGAGDWSKLPELFMVQQQQQRAKHQQATFGSLYDAERARELLQEEAFCGPRNYIGYHNRQSQLEAANNLASTKQQQQVSLGPSRFQVQYLPPPQQQSITAGAGEYPSHMGIYDGTPGDTNYLCAATWLNERYALTLASCVHSIVPQKLTVRVGEWNINKTSSQQQNQDRSMLVLHVDSISVFPKYRNDSGEHDLALLRLHEPIDFLEMPYICPACQVQSRSSLRAGACWAPVRNISLKEYFDASGEGETKVRREFSMMELPIRLLANDDSECYKHTRIEFFNFQHPNYICSPDFRSSEWRRRLNQTDYLGAGIYCNEGGSLNLVSVLHQIQPTKPSSISSPSSSAIPNRALGFMDLTYYKPWIRNVISGRAY